MKISVVVLSLLFALFGPTAALTADEGALQEACGKDAGQFYRMRFEQSFEKGTTTYRPHYNKNLNKCFVSISVHGYMRHNVKIDSLYTVLYDLNAGKELGSFSQVYGDTDDPYPHCITPDKPVAKCSPADWDAFIQHYLQD